MSAAHGRVAIAAALLIFTFCGGARAGDPLTVTAVPMASFSRLTNGTDFGPFDWRGGLTLGSKDKRFGGLSGLVLSENCERLTAVSDDGRWFAAELLYRDGTLHGLSNPRLEPLLDSKGKPQRNKDWADAEAVTRLASGKLGVAYERKTRFGAYDLGAKGFAARFERIRHPKAIDGGPENGEVEAFGQLGRGDYIAIAESQKDGQGNPRAWIWNGVRTVSFALTRHGDFAVTDLVVMANGDVLTMERRFESRTLPAMAVRRFRAADARDGRVIDPELLLEANVALHLIDNMEGIAACERDGETRVTFLSDDNFNRGLQRTLLLQFAYAGRR